MNLQNLKKEISYKWRIQSFSKYKPQATCVAYIDARDVQDLLDEVCGPENWQSEYYQVKNTMCCKIGIKIGEQWVWKSDGGVETDVEKEKGELSDSFKRAAVQWGIGRFLYGLEIKRVNASEVKRDGVWPYVVDENGERIWDLTKYCNENDIIISKDAVEPKTSAYTSQRPNALVSPNLPLCNQCGKEFKARTGKFGNFYSCSGYPNCKNTLKNQEKMNVPTGNDYEPPPLEDLNF